DFSRTWEQAKKMAGLKDFHFHDLRHTFCTNLRRNGADIKTIKDLIGHKDIRMTERYTHIITEEETRYINKLSDHYQK
ncbi:MAG: tyrosine-type recombinase/integrase, partial [Desulfovibrionales bacterium]